MITLSSAPRSRDGLALVLAACLALAALFPAAARADAVILSFSTVGDSRQDPVAPDATTLPLSGQDQIWLQNTKAWSRIMRSIQSQKSNFLFFNGDMIMGYGKADVPADTSTVSAIVDSDLVQTYRQYAFWRGMVAPLMETGTYVVPVPGNHEVQWKAGGKIALEVNENAWRENMGDLILDPIRFKTLLGAPVDHFDMDNHPQIGGAPGNAADINGSSGTDLITTSQRQLSYSFDFKGSHFVIINTDPAGNDSHAPVNWLAADLAAARARGARHFFVFGHKPAYTYFYNDASGTPPKDKPITKTAGFDSDTKNRDLFWNLIETYGATYFCGHEHIFNAQQPTKTTGGNAWQVIVGSGGSPFEAAIVDSHNAATDRMYAWANVRVFQSGKVQLDAYGFDDAYGPTQLIKTIILAH
ncbi:MAG: hypothetical protein BGO99_03645 [Nitrosospira sp. 56-18]|jgi:hypothetical protein|nr:metallophosphoesterase [Nitrosospira sp.]OJY09353.1 MAG: hypothetical protein BGO99_03645 [Nitrosospira sp. 56-18]